MTSDRDRLHPFWHLVDATVLGQDKRIATHRADLADQTRDDPDAALRRSPAWQPRPSTLPRTSSSPHAAPNDHLPDVRRWG